MVAYRFRGQPCFYCGNEADGNDHVIARARGGDNSPKNLVPACQRCNSRKRDLSIEEFRLTVALTDERWPVIFYGEHRAAPARDFLFVASKHMRGSNLKQSLAVI